MDEERDDGEGTTVDSEKKRKPKQKRFRYHNFMLVQQPQYLHPPYDTLEKLLERVEKIGAESYAGILHDKDSGEKDHLHIFVHFKNAREISALARHWGITPERVQKWDDGVENGYAYLTHRTPKARSDYQYDPKEVIANFDYVDWLKKYEAKSSDSSKVATGNEAELDIKFLLDCLYIGAATREEVEQRLSGSQYAKYHEKLMLTIAEAAAYSNIGINRINAMLREDGCPFVFFVGNKKLVKRKAFESYIEEHFML